MGEVKYKLTAYEKETIVLTNEADDFWNVFTYNSALKRRLLKFAEEAPELCEVKEQNEDGSLTFYVKKHGLSVKPRKPMSEEKREKLRVIAKKRMGKTNEVPAE